MSLNSTPYSESAAIALQFQPDGLADQLMATLLRIAEHLQIDIQQARKIPGKPSDVFISAIEARVAAASARAKAGPGIPSGVAAQHPDDDAVDAIAELMKAKLAKKRAEGRGGWQDKTLCTQQMLSDLLRSHVEKGDPVDVANLAMMLELRGESISARSPHSMLMGASTAEPRPGLNWEEPGEVNQLYVIAGRVVLANPHPAASETLESVRKLAVQIAREVTTWIDANSPMPNIEKLVDDEIDKYCIPLPTTALNLRAFALHVGYEIGGWIDANDPQPDMEKLVDEMLLTSSLA